MVKLDQYRNVYGVVRVKVGYPDGTTEWMELEDYEAMEEGTAACDLCGRKDDHTHDPDAYWITHRFAAEENRCICGGEEVYYEGDLSGVRGYGCAVAGEVWQDRKRAKYGPMKEGH